MLDDLYAPLSPYRFEFMIRKAVEFCADVRSLGAALLSALENQDAEELALLRASHEKQVVESIKLVREQQVDEANETLQGLTKTREVTDVRLTYYKQLLSHGLIPQEIVNLMHLNIAHIFESKAGDYELRAARNYRIPDVSLSFKVIPVYPYVIPEPGFGTSYGGSYLGHNARARATAQQNIASNESYQANLASIKAGYDRRTQEWQHQVDLATNELKQIDKQIAAATIRVAIAEQELANLNQQIEHAQEVYDFLSSKYTNQELSSWMETQISGIYFQSYNLAYDLAKRAEKVYQYELGVTTSFITFGYWDSLKKGLLSGELLHHDLRRMEMSYLDQNKREFEITKSISLLQLDPAVLLTLRETGACEIHIPEILFDMDFAGHYFRRIKAVRLTIPCVAGPYTSVSATLRLTQSWIRRTAPVDPALAPELDATVLPQTAIATSSAQNDSGMFELNFRDERYLPFEGAGAVSTWELNLPEVIRAFDYNTIADVVLHVSYTARDGGETAKQAVNGQLISALNDWKELLTSGVTLARVFSLRQEFYTEWSRFLTGDSPQALTLQLTKQHFPRYLDYVWEDTDGDGKPDIQKPIKLQITSVKVYLDPQALLPDAADIPEISINDVTIEPDPPWSIDPDNGLPMFDLDFTGDITNDAGVEVTLTVSGTELRADRWKDMYLLLSYTVIEDSSGANTLTLRTYTKFG